MSSGALSPRQFSSIGEHLQTHHGLDIEGEWHHAPDTWRSSHLTNEGLQTRHAELHDTDSWNEASEKHSH